MERGYSSDWAAELASTLDWWAEAGVDSLVADAPREWLKPAPAPLSGPGNDAPAADSGVPRLRPERAPAETPQLPDQLFLFQEWLRASDALPYASPAAPRVCPVGDPAAGLMILTAMPSSEDCASGAFLSGAAGRLFDRMLAAIGRSRETIYLAGLSCLRPAGGRFDGAGAASCATIARHHVGLVRPAALLLLGDGCTRALLGMSAAQGRGRVHALTTPQGSFNAIVTLAPDYLLTQPSAKAHAWADLQLLMESLK